MDRRIVDLEIGLSHTAPDVCNRMARGTPKPRLRLRRVDLLLDRLVELATEEDGVIVASGAPLRGLRPDRILHILDRFPVPLVVEGGEMMGRGVPLVVDLLVATRTRLRVHEKVRRNRPAGARRRRRWKEWTVRSLSRPLVLHRQRRGCRVDDIVAVGARAPQILRGDHRKDQRQHDSQREGTAEERPLRPPPHHPARHQCQSHQADRDVQWPCPLHRWSETGPLTRRPKEQHPNPNSRTRQQQDPTQSTRHRQPTPGPRQIPAQPNRQQDAEAEVEQQVDDVHERRIVKSCQIRAVDQKQKCPDRQKPGALRDGSRPVIHNEIP